VGLILPYYGAEMFGLRAIGQEALRQHSSALLSLVDTVRLGPGAIVFVVGLLLLGSGCYPGGDCSVAVRDRCPAGVAFRSLWGLCSTCHSFSGLNQSDGSTASWSLSMPLGRRESGKRPEAAVVALCSARPPSRKHMAERMLTRSRLIDFGVGLSHFVLCRNESVSKRGDEEIRHKA